MDLGLEGKVALITGASRGMGKAIATAFAREGVRVAICARGVQRLEEAAQDIRQQRGAEVVAVAADVSRLEDIRRLVRETLGHFGRIDILVNNAGGPPMAPFTDVTEEMWDTALAMNLRSVIRLCHEVIPHMRKQGGGCILNLTSISVKQPIDRLVLSNVARLGVIGLTKTLANELAKDNIRVNSVCPGFILTERIRELAEAKATRENKSLEEVLAEWEREIPMGRMGTPEEVADLFVFLASERASYITGVAFHIDGGYFKGIF